MRATLLVLCMLLGYSAPGYSAPDISINITLSSYPNMSRVPGYPLYYATDLNANYFFYDGWYWVYLDDNWYASSWYNGPWELVTPDAVPLYVLRIPVRYYRAPPTYFTGWRSDAPPRWHDHWGNQWAQQHRGWDRWDRHIVLTPAPLPSYQRRYSGNDYPKVELGQQLANKNYRYRPRDPVVRQRVQHQSAANPGPRATPVVLAPVPQARRQARSTLAEPQAQPPRARPQVRPPRDQPQAQPLRVEPQTQPPRARTQAQAPRSQPPRHAKPQQAAPHQQNRGHKKDKGDEHGPRHDKGKN
jgi:hypothetical protein